MELSEKALRLEKAGNEEDGEFIHENTGELLELYLSYIDILQPYFPEDNKEVVPSKIMSHPELMGYFDSIRTAIEELDFDAMEYVLEVMSEYKYDGEPTEWFTQLKEAVAEYDVDKCEEIMQQWEKESS